MTPQQAILGMVLAEPDNIAILKDRGIFDEIFFDPKEREIWRAIESLSRTGEQFDAMRIGMTVSTEAKVLIGTLISDAPVAQKIEAYADEAIAIFQTNKFSARLNTLARMMKGRRPFEPIEAIFAEMSALSQEANLALCSKPTKETLKELLLEHTSILEARIENAAAGILPGISTGFKNIDAEMSGFQKGDLIVVTARPGIGKTTMTLQFAVIAAKAGHAVGFFSTEMTQMNLVDKIVSGSAKVVQKGIKSGNLNTYELDAIAEAYSTISDCKLFIPKTTPFLEAIEAKARMMKAAGELDLLVIENVGNLICTVAYDLGEDLRIVVVSIAEGEDKPLKYPSAFVSANTVAVTTTDLEPYVNARVEIMVRNALSCNPGLRIFPLSARTGEGVGAFAEYIAGKLANR